MQKDTADKDTRAGVMTFLLAARWVLLRTFHRGQQVEPKMSVPPPMMLVWEAARGRRQ